MAKKYINNLDKIVYFVLFLVLLLFVVNILLINERFSGIKDAREVLAEKSRPANLEVTMVLPSNCNDCYDINLALEQLKKQNVNITNERTISLDDSSDLITEYNLLSLPAIIITGEANKSEQLIKFFEYNGVFVDNSTALFTKIMPPYYSVESKKVVGRVSITNVIDSLCDKCKSLLIVVDSLKTAGVAIVSEKNVEYDSDEGKRLIMQNEIKAVPALIISDEIDYYTDIKEQIDDVGLVKRLNSYAMHATIPPYRNLTENKIVGLADLITLYDSSCEECYDTTINKLILQRLGVVINAEESYDVNSADGQRLVEKYNITKVPIIILSPEAFVYENFVRAWNSVGTVEDDGWFVMTHPEFLGTYKDLSTGRVVARENDQ